MYRRYKVGVTWQCSVSHPSLWSPCGPHSPLIISPAPFFDQLVLLSNNESNEERPEGTDWSWAAGQTIFSQHLTDNRNYDLTETDRKQKAEEGGGGKTDIIESDKNAGFLASHNRRNSLKHYILCSLVCLARHITVWGMRVSGYCGGRRYMM